MIDLRSTILIRILAAGALLTPVLASAQTGTVIASDDFDRADESPFAVGENWGRVIAGNYDGVADLTNHQVTSVSNEGIYYWQGAGTFNTTRQFARQRVVQKDGELGLVLLGGPDQSIMVGWGPPGVGSTVYIYWYAGGLDHGQLATAPSTLNNGDIIEAVLDGGVIYAKVNGATVASVTNTTTLTSGTPGFITYLNPNLPGQVSILDDWEAGTPPAYTISGTITEDAAGLGGVLVTASGGFSGSTTTAGDGTYTITGVPAEATSVLLTPTLSGHSMSPLTRTVAGPVIANVTDEDFSSTLNNGFVLTINASHGSVTRDPDQATYTNGTEVTLTPVPEGGYSFSGWSGDVPVGHGTDDPLVVMMDQDRTISASFLSPNTIASDDFNRANETPLVVGGNWQQPFGGGTVNLTSDYLVGASGEALYYWQGSGTFDNAQQFARSTVVNAGGQVGLVLLGATGQALVAAWNAGTLYIYWYTGGSYQSNLTTTSSTLQNGDIIEAVLDGGIIYARRNGATVASVANTTTLTSGRPGFETYQTGAVFDDWEAGTPPANTISGTIIEDAAGLGGVLVTASGGFSGSTTTAGDGTYTITGVPDGATSILLTPTLSGHTMNPLTRTVAGPVAGDVTGEDFTSIANSDFVLTINASHGSVTRDPDQATYTNGTEVTLTPVPDGGYSFTGWSGDVPVGHETDDPLVVMMDQDRTINASFISPDLIASDDFNRANETPLVVGGNWQQPFSGGTVNLIGSHAAGAGGEALYYWQGSGTFDNAQQFARSTVVNAGGQVGLVLLGASGQALVAAWHAGTLYIYWYTGGSYQGNLTTTSSTLQNGDLIEAVLDGGVIHALRNGVTVASVANTTTLTSGRPGFETFQTGAVFDDWEAGTPPAYTISGTITEDAAGLGGVLVTANGGFSGSTTTAGDGTYTISGVPTGATGILLTPTLSGHSMSPLTRTVAGPVIADVTDEDFSSTLNNGFVLTINASHGSVTRFPDRATYINGTEITLTPIPDAGYSFTGWSGDVPVGHETDDPLVVVMDQDRTITASFHSPNVVAFDDFNRANETPLAVGGNWQQPFGGGTDNLIGEHLVSASGEALYSWQGSGTFDNARQFARLKVLQAGGQVGLVLLGASATGQALVVSWGGGRLYIYWYLNGSHQGELANEPSVLQDGDVIEGVLDNGTVQARINGVTVKTVTNTTSLTAGKPGFETYLTGAVFDDWEAGTPPAYAISGTITEDAAGLGGVLVTASGGFSGSTTTAGDGTYTISDVPNEATGIVLTPTLSGHAMSPLTRTVAGPVTADVTGEDFTSMLNNGFVLAINASHGSVTRDPDQAIYTNGMEVTLTPVPDGGYDFTGWSGDVPVGHETDDPLVVMMDQDRTISASFLSPNTVASDDFNRANETPLVVGGNWQQPFGGGTVNLTSDYLVGASGEALYYWQGSGTFDNARQFARLKVLWAGGQVGLVLLGESGQALVAAWNAGTLYIYWYTGGSYQGNLTTVSSTLQDGDLIEAVLDDGMIHAMRNGVIIASVANTTTLTSGRPGFETYQTGAVFDNWEAGTPAVDAIRVKVRVMLDGPYDEGTDLMNDDLRVDGLIPSDQPYASAPFGYDGQEMVSAPVLAVSGEDAVVDWVLLELRDKITPSIVLAARAALVQRDGDVVDVDGLSPVTFENMPGDEYYISVRHRNHLGVLTASAIALSDIPTSIDLADAGTSTYGTNSRRSSGARMLLWAGNALVDDQLRYTGSSNDRDAILVAIGGTIPTNVLLHVYASTDVTMDGRVQYVGAGNDRDPILVNIGGSIPTNTRTEQLP